MKLQINVWRAIMEIINVKDEISIPDFMKKHLSGMPIEQQLKFFSLEKCSCTTHSILNRHVTPSDRYPGYSVIIEGYPILVQDGIVVGVDIGEKLYCFEHQYSKVISSNGHRTSTDYWYYEEDHSWYVFKYTGQ